MNNNLYNEFMQIKNESNQKDKLIEALERENSYLRVYLHIFNNLYYIGTY